LRRVKEDVMRDLPHKVERTVLCPLSRMQVTVTVTVTGGASSTRIPLPHPLPSPPSLPLCNPSRRPQTFLYNNFRKAAARYAEGGGNDAADDETDDDAGVGAGAGAVARRGVGKLSYANCLMQLRKLCNHPYLLLEDVRTIPDALYHRYLVAARSVSDCSGPPPAPPLRLSHTDAPPSVFFAASGKLCMLDALLQNLLPAGHKVPRPPHHAPCGAPCTPLFRSFHCHCLCAAGAHLQPDDHDARRHPGAPPVYTPAPIYSTPYLAPI